MQSPEDLQDGTGAWQYIECRTDLCDTGEQWTAVFANPPPTAIQTNIFMSGGTKEILIGYWLVRW